MLPRCSDTPLQNGLCYIKLSKGAPDTTSRCYLYHCVADDFVADFVSGLEHVSDLI